jgi:SAM-dependent methyltransferase
VNELEPPLPYAGDAFDFVYVYSVFTHLSVDLARRWMDELARIIKPGGLMWFTVHGESYRERLAPEQRERFDSGEIVVSFPEIEGTNLCSTYWPEAAVKAMLAGGFEPVVHFDPRADPQRAEQALLTHDAYLVVRAAGDESNRWTAASRGSNRRGRRTDA